MLLLVDSDATYLVLLKARSRLARYHYLSSILPMLEQTPMLNTLILVVCESHYHIISLTVEAETARVFANVQIILLIGYIFKYLDH